MSSPMESQKLGQNSKTRVIQMSVLTAGFLTVLKVGIGLATHSMCIVASAVDSLMDVLVSTVNYISLREAEKPADHDHAYGHGKIESLAGLFQSLLISVSGLFLICESVKRLIQGEQIVFVDTGIVVMAISMVVTFFLVKKLKSVATRTGSIIVGTETLHFSTDFLSNGGVIAALILVRISGQVIWDLVVALAIAGYILKQSFRILRNSIDELIDRALPDEMQKEIGNIIDNFDRRIIGHHNLRTRKIGGTKFIDFHVELRKNLGFQEAHDLTEDLIAAIETRYPDSDVNAHYDPEGGR